MENFNSSKEPFYGNPKIMLPNATAVLVLGICSIVFSCVGLVLGIIGIVLASKGRKMYREAPHLYDGYGQLNAGYIMSIIGVCIGGLTVLYLIIGLLILGSSPAFWSILGGY